MEGFGWFTHEVFKRIASQHPEHEFIFIFDRKFDPSFVYSSNVTPVVKGPMARHPFLYYYWFEYSIPSVLKKTGAQLFVSPDGYLSLSTQVPSISVMHDLNFEHYPKDLKPILSKYYRKYFPKFAHKAHHLLTVSEYSKQDIAKRYNVSPDKITVSHNGADEAFVKIGEKEIDGFRKKIKVTNPYFLSVGSIHPRKNITRLLQAFDIFKKEKASAYTLVLVGDKYNFTPEMKTVLENMQFKNDVVFTGHLAKTDLINAYSGAKALIFPSYFEGFGIPLVEAMRCECPVICANTTCFPEVAGDAALYFDPFNITDMAARMKEFSENDSLAADLIKKGNQRVQQFTWQKTADTVWSVIEKTARAKGLLA